MSIWWSLSLRKSWLECWLLCSLCFIAAYRNRTIIMWKYDVTQKTGSTQQIATPPEEDRSTATGNMHKNRRSSAVWFLSYGRGQTDRHDILIAILHIYVRGEEITEPLPYHLHNLSQRVPPRRPQACRQHVEDQRRPTTCPIVYTTTDHAVGHRRSVGRQLLLRRRTDDVNIAAVMNSCRSNPPPCHW